MSSRSCLTVLVIDDCAEDRVAIARYLNNDRLYNYRIWELETGSEAMEWCQQQIPDVILLDYLLPDSNGLELVQQLRQDLSLSQCAIIMLTGQGDEILAVQAMKNGLQDYLVKNSLTPKILQGAIHHARERMHLMRQLEHSQQQQQLIAAIASRIRQSLQLSEILPAIATEVRQFLKADRVVVYQFDDDMSGTIVAESVLPGWKVALGCHIPDTCFQQGAGAEYHQGKKRAIDDIYQAGLTKCHLQLLEQFEVKANLVVPILVKHQLWGLLIAHQCSSSRHWQSVELELLDQLGVQIAIAIQQASAYQQLQMALLERQQAQEQLQQLNQELETRIKQRTDALKASKIRLLALSNLQQAILDGTDYAIISTAEDLKIQTFNAAAERMLGYTAEEVIGCSSPELFHDSVEVEKWLATLSLEVGGKIVNIQEFLLIKTEAGSYEVECTHIRKDGYRFPVLLSVKRLQNDQREIIGFVGIVKDITKRKQAEAALQASERRYATLAAAAPVAIFRLDTLGNCTYVNAEWSVMTGRSAETALGMGWLQALHPEDSDRLMREKLETISESGVNKFEGRHLHPDGSITWFYSQVVPEIDAEGTLLGYVGTLTDITERQQAEEELRQTNEQLATTNAQLARATRLKDEFLASMSHELRTPLNAILGMSEGLQEGIFGDINHRQQNAIATIERSGRHLLELINDILDLSKIESGKLELEISKVPIRSLCENSLIFIRQMALKKKIQITSLIPDDIGSIQADHRRLRQVLINLLSNAVKFTPEGGNITLAVTRLANNHNDQNPTCVDWIVFSVSDTGIGIAPENFHKLFQPFSQVDSSLSRHYNGTGLGLSLVRQIAELHGGQVIFTSELGEGSCFMVQIPAQPPPLAWEVAQGEVVAVSISPDDIITTQSPLILLAEDNEANVEMFTIYLESLGYRYILAANGEQAIALTKRHHPDLILMDIQMPKVDGLEAIRQIRADQEFARLPIIALTALAMPGDKEKCLQAGANEYLTKPISPKFLVAKIQQFLG
jgi:PAS domain S-box-containing protein